MSFNPCDGNCTSNLPPECCNSDNPYFARGYTPLECINKVNEGVRQNYNSIREIYKELYREKCCSKVFYPDDVIKMESGVYTHANNTTSVYYIIKVKNKDENDNLVEFKLYGANDNLTNNGLTETIFSANSNLLPNLSFPACNVITDNSRWYGLGIVNGAVIPTETTGGEFSHYNSFGFNINGEMKYYAKETPIDTLIADGIQNSIGCDGIIIQNEQPVDVTWIQNNDLLISRVCIGQTRDLTTYVLICGTGTEANASGLSLSECITILSGYNCVTAVECVSDNNPESGTDLGSVAYGTFKGQMVMPPYKDNPIPANMYWYISLKDTFQNKYECELANLYMILGKYSWTAFTSAFDPTQLELMVATNTAAITTLNTAIENITNGNTELPYIKKNNGTGTGTTTLDNLSVSQNTNINGDLNAQRNTTLTSLILYKPNLIGEALKIQLGQLKLLNVMTNYMDSEYSTLIKYPYGYSPDLLNVISYVTFNPSNDIANDVTIEIRNGINTLIELLNTKLTIKDYPTYFDNSNIDIQNSNLVIKSNAGFVCEGTTQVPETPPTDTSIASKKYVDYTTGVIENNITNRFSPITYGTQTSENVTFTLSSYLKIPYVKVTASDVSFILNYAITNQSMASYLETILQDGEILYLVSGSNAPSSPYASTNMKILRTGNTFMASIQNADTLAASLNNTLFMGIYLP